jgi:beta-fructofuranosidase
MKIDRRKFLLHGTSAAVAACTLPGASGWQSPAPPHLDLAKDPLRPQIHLLPAANWINDPNSPLYWLGK